MSKSVNGYLLTIHNMYMYRFYFARMKTSDLKTLKLVWIGLKTSFQMKQHRHNAHVAYSVGEDLWYRIQPGAQRVYLKCIIRGTNNQLPNIFYKFVHLKLKLLIFKLFEVESLFSKNHVFRKWKRTAVYGLMDACPQFRILNSPGKMVTCYLQDIKKFLRYRTLCKSILKYGFPTKGIELTRFILFEALGVPQI